MGQPNRPIAGSYLHPPCGDYCKGRLYGPFALNNCVEFVLPDPTFVLHARVVLQLPLVDENVSCAYIMKGAHRQCGKPLDAQCLHAASCCSSAVGSRHTALSKMWTGLTNMARWPRPAHNEQLISVADNQCHSQYTRADIVVTLPSGQHVAGDVRSLGCHAPNATMLQKPQAKKLSEHLVRNGDDQQGSVVKIVPLVHPLFGMMGEWQQTS